MCRKVARAHPEGRKEPVIVTPDNRADFLGPLVFVSEIAERTRIPGVATGLAWTPTGGDILFIEATRMRGSRPARANPLARHCAQSANRVHDQTSVSRVRSATIADLSP